MNLNLNLSSARNRSVRCAGFSPIETVGALSVVGMLSVSVLPRIFTAVNESRLNGAVQSYMIVKSAALRYLDQAAAPVQLAAGETLPAWDQVVLQPAGFLDQPFTTKISEHAHLAITPCPPPSSIPTAANSAYSFSGLTPTAPATAGGQIVVEAILEGVARDDARELNRRIDGDERSRGESHPGTDVGGRVKYDFGSQRVGAVRIYVTHR